MGSTFEGGGETLGFPAQLAGVGLTAPLGPFGLGAGQHGESIRKRPVPLGRSVLGDHAARGLAWPMRAIGSSVLAPVDTARVFPVCLRSGTWNPARPAALQAGCQFDG
jgi:hypothetical protein